MSRDINQLFYHGDRNFIFISLEDPDLKKKILKLWNEDDLQSVLLTTTGSMIGIMVFDQMTNIEGISTKKDPHDGKRILRADITGLAICSNPKNKNTLMNIVKGHYDVPFIELETVDSVIQGKQSKNYGEGIDVFNVNNHTDLKKLVQRLDNENDMIIKKSGQSDPILEKAICAIESLYTVPIESYYRLRSMNIILQRD